MKKTLFILLGTYNGAKYVREQIKSIQSQTHEEWFLLVRDDGSSDKTVQLIDSLARSDPRITLMNDDHGNVGASQNFSLLAQEARRRDADYIMFCDQDDIWLPKKVELSMGRMIQLESIFPSDTPVLVHSDLIVTDENLTILHKSFSKMQQIRHESEHPLQTLLVQNFVTGCTCIANKNLVDIAEPVSPAALMHDWWYALIAASTGTIDYIQESTILYRQHSMNTIGAKGYWKRMNPFKRDLLQRLSVNKTNYVRSINQACALADYLPPNKIKENRSLVHNYCRAMKNYSRHNKVLFLLKNHIQKQTILSNSLLYLRAIRTEANQES